MSNVSSMTGYAAAQAPTAAGTLTVDLRSVNSRFLDLTLRIPEELKFLEPAIREAISGRVKRGKLECRMSLAAAGAVSEAKLNEQAVRALAQAQDAVKQCFPQARELSVAEVLVYPGVMESAAPDTDALSGEVLGCLSRSLDVFCAPREREGAALAALMLDYCKTIEDIAREVETRVPEIVASVKSKLEERLSEALSRSLSENSSLSAEEVNERIRAELTLYALRIDVAEEINRLLTHVREVRRVLDAGGPVGRRLDFLMQELNREANTLGSKATAIEMTNASVDLKTTIEKMREQIQNLE